jgi:hypothetical protein
MNCFGDLHRGKRRLQVGVGAEKNQLCRWPAACGGQRCWENSEKGNLGAVQARQIDQDAAGVD